VENEITVTGKLDGSIGLGVGFPLAVYGVIGLKFTLTSKIQAAVLKDFMNKLIDFLVKTALEQKAEYDLADDPYHGEIMMDIINILSPYKELGKCQVEAEIEGEVALNFMVGYHAVTEVGIKVNLDLAAKLPDPSKLLQCFDTKTEQQKAQDMAAAREELKETLETADCFETAVTPNMMKEISGGLTETEFKQKTSQERDATSLGSYTLFSTFPTEMGEVSKIKVKATLKCISAAFSFVKACAKQTKDAVVGVFSGEAEAFNHEITGETALDRRFIKSLDSFDAAKTKFDGILAGEEKLQQENKANTQQGSCVPHLEREQLKTAIADSEKSVQEMRGLVVKAEDKPAAIPAADELIEQDAEGFFGDTFVTLQWSFTSVEIYIEKNFKDLAELEWTRSASGGEVTHRRSVSVLKGFKPAAKPAAGAAKKAYVVSGALALGTH